MTPLGWDLAPAMLPAGEAPAGRGRALLLPRSGSGVTTAHIEHIDGPAHV